MAALALSPEQERLRDEFRTTAQDVLGADPTHVQRDRDRAFSRDLWRRCAELGVLAWAVPQTHGGRGLDLLSTVSMMEALGYACRDAGLTFGLGTQIWGVQKNLLRFGTPEQVQRYLGDSMRGECIGAFGMTEASSGSDAFGLSSTAVKDGDSYVLNGEKVLITFGPIADFSIVIARTNPDAGQWGLSAFIVERTTPGYVAHPPDDNMGLRTVPVGSITLTDCRVPATSLLGKEGAGASIFNFTQGWERSLILAPQVGAMARQLDQCVAHARTRKRAGKPIGKHQAVSHRIAEMKLRLETARLLLYHTASLQQNNRPNMMEAALTKIHLSETFTQSSLDAIAIHGGVGYQTEMQVERDLRDAIGATIYGGTGDLQRNIVAGLLGL